MLSQILEISAIAGMGRAGGPIWEDSLKRPRTYSQLDHETIAVGRVSEVQHITVADVHRGLRQNVYAHAPDAVDRIAGSKRHVRRRCSREDQAVIFGHELNAFCREQNKAAAHMELV